MQEPASTFKLTPTKLANHRVLNLLHEQKIFNSSLLPTIQQNGSKHLEGKIKYFLKSVLCGSSSHGKVKESKAVKNGGRRGSKKVTVKNGGRSGSKKGKVKNGGSKKRGRTKPAKDCSFRVWPRKSGQRKKSAPPRKASKRKSSTRPPLKTRKIKKRRRGSKARERRRSTKG
ncbi:hypothetical protein AVEN_79807-1 [Araneus ventricosus]|uniref:Uncharacterized protein n=1 Tax=Araneus ventricosus TaxID=182803 RepID=A0A4Y2J7N4_ARAVE|nr:hypothetical protein AVEN_21271-1 [Araneus ventricosus]GBM86281.1 hypothetical protein AVEN_79807-1 [Araneus ventricosus]